MREKLLEMLADRLGKSADGISVDDDVMLDLGGDSLECVELICEIEDEFKVEIEDEYAPELRSVRAMADYLDEKLK